MTKDGDVAAGGRAPVFDRALAEVLDLHARNTDCATVTLARDGRIVHLSQGFFDLVALEGAAPATLADLVAALRGGADACASLVGDLLLQHDADARGDLALPDGRVLLWAVSETAGDTGFRVWSFRNVAFERASLRALRDADNWLRMFSVHAEGVVVELDLRGRLVGLWAQDQSFFDAPEHALQGRTFGDILGSTEGELVDARVRDVIATGRPSNFEYVTERAGERRVYAANAVLLGESEGYPATVTVLVRDVTERARLERQLLQAERLAALGLLAAGIAHEINNPLAYMLLNLERILRGVREMAGASEGVAFIATLADLERCATISVEGAKRVHDIVNDLRRFARSDDHEPRKLVDVRDVLRFTLGLTAPELTKHANVIRDFGPVPKVLAGEGRLNQVFLNLIVNAAQAIPDGAPSDHEVRIVTSTDPEGNAVVEVRDTGCGIPEADLKRIFDPFFTTKPASIGTGLGLAICHGITTSFGGALTASSQLGVGSTFRVVLPPAPGPDG